MKIWILSSDSQIQSTKRLLEAAQASQIETEVLNPLHLQFEFGRKSSKLFHQGKQLKQLPDLVLPRLGWQSLTDGLRLLFYFESIGIPVVNSAFSFQKATDKLLSLQLFHQAGLSVPQTRHAALTSPSGFHLIEKSDGSVFKTLQGSQGFGVTWTQNRPQSLAQVDAYRTLQAPFLTQELIRESFGQDIRVFVIHGEIVAAMKRKGPAKDLRSNLHQGGKSSAVILKPKEKQLALQAAEVLGLHYSGVDLMRTQKGTVLLEANPTPGFEGISKTCKVDVAQLLLQSLTKF